MSQVDPNLYTWPFQLTETLHRDPYDDILPTNSANSQKGKIIIITGAYGGIGSAAARVWAQAGASGIVLAGRKTDRLAKVEHEVRAAATNPNAQVLSISVDITIEAEVQNLYSKIQSKFSRAADFLINNAGPSITAAPSAQIPFDDFTKVITGHFLGTVLMTKYFILSQPSPADPVGTVVFITSGVGGMIIPGMSSYSIAKYAGDRFTEYLDAEYPHLRAFTLSPGIPHTTLTRDSFKPFAKDHVELPGMMCLYLSQERANYLKGGWVGVNWDVHEMEKHKDEIVEGKLLKMKWLPANFGKGGHPFERTA